jgi:predicted transcriptional regulator
VPYSRFAEVNEKLKAAEKRAQELEARGARNHKIAQQHASLKESVTAMEAKHKQEVALIRAGIADAEDGELIRQQYERTAGTGKDRPDFGEWLTGKLADPPRWLKGMLPEAASVRKDAGTDSPSEAGEPAGGSSVTPEPTVMRSPAINPNAGAKPAGTSAKPQFATSDIRGMDLETYRAQRAEILKAAKTGQILPS